MSNAAEHEKLVRIYRMQTDRNYHALRMQPSMKIDKKQTDITEIVDPDGDKRIQRMRLKNLGAPKKRFRLENRNNSSLAYQTAPEHGSSAMQTILFRYKDGKLLYTKVDLHRAVFASTSVKTTNIEDLEREESSKEDMLRQRLASSKGKLSQLLSVSSKDSSDQTKADDATIKHKKSMNKSGMGFIDDDIGIDFSENFDDDDDNELVMDIEKDEFDKDVDDGGNDSRRNGNSQSAHEGDRIQKLLEKNENLDDFSESSEEEASDNFADLDELSAAEDSDDDEEDGGDRMDEDVKPAPTSSRKRSSSAMVEDEYIPKRIRTEDDSVPGSELVTEADIREMFARHIQMTSKTLISKLSSKLKYGSKADKQAFSKLIRRLCNITPRDGEQFLTLKK